MADEAKIRESFRVQAAFCDAMGAPMTASLCHALAVGIDRGSETGRRVLDWPGEPIADALPLRLVGGIHALYRDRQDDAVRLFAGEPLVAAVLARHDAALLPWLDGPPQTNEVARSAALMTGLLHLAARHGPAMELIEIGSSAGLNLVMHRFRFDLGGVRVGPADAPLALAPDWRGPPPPQAPVRIVATHGVDRHPVDVADPAQAARLAAYVWIDAAERQARLERAIALVRAEGVDLVRGDAADWVEARLAAPQPAGVARVLIHSVVWQYLGDERRARIRAAMAAAGAGATPDRPLGWVMMEPDRAIQRHEVRVASWPGDTTLRRVATVHPHGAWIAGGAPPYPAVDD